MAGLGRRQRKVNEQEEERFRTLDLRAEGREMAAGMPKRGQLALIIGTLNTDQRILSATKYLQVMFSFKVRCVSLLASASS